jgi:hypothetical protein
MPENVSLKTGARTCLCCGKPLNGRTDKKFCDDYCRNNYHNLANAEPNNYVRNINSALHRNRRILEEVLDQQGMTKVGKARLLNEGIQFKYHTHTYTTAKGSTYLFCYEYGYLPLEHDQYLFLKSRTSDVRKVYSP